MVNSAVQLLPRPIINFGSNPPLDPTLRCDQSVCAWSLDDEDAGQDSLYSPTLINKPTYQIFI